ncbi:ABC transporter ATP-binding protein [Evansella sp. AB-P1]|uniref:ABC transporter ATP-binding protein n=1 Tax=Evansella sp. AB-P1 TaxID=3037653 RepID=UPI00241E0131|nr:ABC transporter ATP-binding protein [Evansella sp. AB-P1]MDG5789385.1 ABC transporter ATP-binding protein [Evansella sp. AB-P1]
MLSATNSTLIEVENLKVEFPTKDGTFLALSDINLEIKKGEFVCLLGPSGCGKSTLLFSIGKQLKPTGGSITFNKEKLDHVSSLHEKMCVVFQEHALFPWLTVEKNIQFPLEVKGMSKTKIKEISEYYMDMVGLFAFRDRKPNQLSGGMKQRVGIARALSMETEVILMDEPFGALDAQTRGMLQEELIDIWEREKRTILFVTHGIDEAVFLADKIVVMSANPGKIKDIIDVDLGRMRDTTSTEFVQYEREIKGLLHTEILKTKQLESSVR